MNKGAVEFFSRGCRRCEQRWKKGGAVRDTDANRIERIGVETGHGFLYECLAWNNLGPIKAVWQPATRTTTGGRVCSESLGRAIFIFILFLGHYPWDPAHLVPSSIFAKDEPSVSNFAPTLRHVFSRWIRQNCWKLSSIRIQFFLFSFCNKWMEVEMKYVTIVRGEKNDRSSSRCWREISKF